MKAIATGKTSHPGRHAKVAATQIERTLDTLYYAAFLDPAAWQSGHYDAAWRLFAPNARAGARHQERTLTLGPAAGSLYDSIAPGRNGLFIRVLLDPAGRPRTAAVSVLFTAKATARAGGTTAITSTGQYFLAPAGRHAWTISGYAVKRSGGRRS